MDTVLLIFAGLMLIEPDQSNACTRAWDARVDQVFVQLHLDRARDPARLGRVVLDLLQLDLLEVHRRRRAPQELEALGRGRRETMDGYT